MDTLRLEEAGPDDSSDRTAALVESGGEIPGVPVRGCCPTDLSSTEKVANGCKGEPGHRPIRSGPALLESPSP